MLRISLLFLICISANAQVKGVVKDSISGQPVPYVNIWVENGNLGTTSAENGTFTINANLNSKLVFSAVGYESKTINTPEAATVSLKESLFKLDEVTVQRLKSEKEINAGTYNKKDVNFYYACYGQPWMVAKYFAYNSKYDETPFLKKVTLLTESYKKGAGFNLRILEVDAYGGPGKELLDENIVTKVKKGKNNTEIDLSKYQIKIPENGFFIAYEFLIIEENKYELDIQGQKDPVYSYLPSLGAVPSDTETTWRYLMGAWCKMDSTRATERIKKYEGKFTELAIQLTLTN